MQTIRRLITTVLMLFCCAASSESLHFVTESFPPYNYADNRIVKGLGFDVVEEMSRRVDEHTVKYQLLPWLRAYHLAQKEENTAIFSIGRNSEREDMFHWVGIIAPAKYFFFAMKDRDDISVYSLEDAKRYKVGTFPKSVREQYLTEHGFTLGENLVSILDYERLVDLLHLHRIDLWPANELRASYIISKKGLDPNKMLKKVYYLDDLSPGGYYLAFSTSTDKGIVNAFQVALDSMKVDGTYLSILEKYNLSP